MPGADENQVEATLPGSVGYHLSNRSFLDDGLSEHSCFLEASAHLRHHVIREFGIQIFRLDLELADRVTIQTRRKNM